MAPINSNVTGNVAKLGKISNFSVSTSAVPYDTSDTSGVLPTFSASYAEAENPEYLIGETLKLSTPTIGEYEGEIVSVGGSAKSNVTGLDANTTWARLNSDIRVFPLDVLGTVNTYSPLAAIEYWSQSCGMFMDEAPGQVQFFQSGYFHPGAYSVTARNPVISVLYSTTPTGTPVSYLQLGGRWVQSFGTEWPLTTALNGVDQLPLRVPAESSSWLEFSGGIFNGGIGRSAESVWTFVNSDKAVFKLRVTFSTTTGYKLERSENGTAYTNIGTIPDVEPTIRRYYINLREVAGGQTEFQFRLLGEDSAFLGSVALVATSKLRKTVWLTKVEHTGFVGGSGAVQGHFSEYVSETRELPVKYPRLMKVLRRGLKASDGYPGFSGNAWEHIKQWCSIYYLDASYENGRLVIGPRETDRTQVSATGDFSRRASAREQARFVEVVNHNFDYTGYTNRVMWSADSVYEAVVGKTEEFLVQTPHSIKELSQPVAVSGISPFPYLSGAGQYVVTGSDGYIVSPAFWRDQGGRITVEITQNEGEIKVTIKGPDFDSPRAPYRISEGDAGRPALYVTGQGIITKAETIRVATGNFKAAKEVGATIDLPFVGSLDVAYDVAVRAARAYAVPETSVTMTEAHTFDNASSLGDFPGGSVVIREGNAYRVTSATQNPSNTTANAEQHNTIRLINKSFGAGATIGDLNRYYDGKTIGQINVRPLKEIL